MNATFLPTDWANLLSEAIHHKSYQKLQSWLSSQRALSTVYPPENEVFTAFHLTSFTHLKVVILGQDPYHGQGQAHGLSFSVKSGIKVPPSLRNMYKELESDLGLKRADPKMNGDLSLWASQGVLLLNTVLTVRAGEANSHRKQGWEDFTDEVIRQINAHKDHVVFVLWGKPAQQKLTLIDESKHSIVVSAHPSPLSAHHGFLGSAPYSKVNKALVAHAQDPIDWSLV